jgi:hypothetical protein
MITTKMAWRSFFCSFVGTGSGGSLATGRSRGNVDRQIIRDMLASSDLKGKDRFLASKLGLIA